MALAMIYPEAEKGGRGKNSKLSLEINCACGTVVSMSGENPDSNADKNAGALGRFKSPETKA